MGFTHKSTGKYYNNRKEAKQDLGNSAYKKALKNREFIFV